MTTITICPQREIPNPNTRKVLIEKFGVKQIVNLIVSEIDKKTDFGIFFTQEDVSDLYDRIERIVDSSGTPSQILFSTDRSTPNGYILDVAIKPPFQDDNHTSHCIK